MYIYILYGQTHACYNTVEELAMAIARVRVPVGAH